MTLQLYMTDFCPFAQRAWLTLLEKEADPYNPKLFNYIEVNFYNKSLPRTQEFLKIHNTVPAGRFGDQELRESVMRSLPMCYWADEQWKHNPLQPASEEGRARMKALIEKYTSGPFSVTDLLYKSCFAQKPDEIQKANARLLEAYAQLSADLAASGGPYLLGSQFTLADIALIPFIDRAVVCLGHYKGLVVPRTPAYESFHKWRAAYSARDSHKISDADRLPRSLEVQPFEKVKRDEYLIEMYQAYANDVREEMRRQLANAPPGKSTFNLQAARAEKAAKLESERRHLIAHRALIGFAVASAVAIAFGANIARWWRRRHV